MPTPDTVERRTVLIIATLAAFLTSFMGSAVNIALPSIAREFGMDAVSLSLVANTNAVMSSVLRTRYGVASGMIATMRTDRYDVLPGHRHHDLRGLPGEHADRAGRPPGVPCKPAGGVHDLLRALHPGHLRIPCTGEGARR